MARDGIGQGTRGVPLALCPPPQRDHWTDAPDAELLQGCRAGDPLAWTTLVARYERLIFSVALRNGVSREDAADVTQLTFIALLGSVDRLRDDERLASWLMIVARRQAWRVRRRNDQDLAARESPDPSEDPFAAWERAAALHDGLRRLGAPCRELLSALYFDPVTPSYVEVADALGRAVGGIGPARARCLQRLRALLEEEGEA
jgi:RNA polymerase sigma factor (sigma-70 family)